MTFKELQEQAEEISKLSGRRYAVKAQNGMVALVEMQGSTGGHTGYSVWTASHKELGQMIEFFRRGLHVGKKKALSDLAEHIKLQIVIS